MERKIGEIFKHNGEWYQCVEQPDYIGDVCKVCSFSGIRNCELDRCSETYRSDKKSVIFKKLEKVGEPYMLEDKKFQKYRVFHTPYIYHKIDYSWQSFADPYYVSLEIKQTKKDMEEKEQCGDNRFEVIEKAKKHLLSSTNIESSKEEMKVLDNFLIRCWQMGWLDKYNDTKHSNSEKIGKNLKPFDLQKAKAGKPVCTRDGRKARIICFDLKNDEYPIVAAVENDSSETLFSYTTNGEIADGIESDKDLMLLPEKKEGWVNVYKTSINYECGTVFSTEQEAKNKTNDGRIATVRIEWEE